MREESDIYHKETKWQTCLLRRRNYKSCRRVIGELYYLDIRPQKKEEISHKPGSGERFNQSGTGKKEKEKALGEYSISVDLINDAGAKAVTKLPINLIKHLEIKKILKVWTNAGIMLIHEKEGDIFHYLSICPVSCLPSDHKQNFRHIRFKAAERTCRLSKWVLNHGSQTDINQVVEKTYKYRKLLCLAFINCKEGSESVDTITALM